MLFLFLFLKTVMLAHEGHRLDHFQHGLETLVETAFALQKWVNRRTMVSTDSSFLPIAQVFVMLHPFCPFCASFITFYYNFSHCTQLPAPHEGVCAQRALLHFAGRNGRILGQLAIILPISINSRCIARFVGLAMYAELRDTLVDIRRLTTGGGGRKKFLVPAYNSFFGGVPPEEGP